jgi:hypothetical protein
MGPRPTDAEQESRSSLSKDGVFGVFVEKINILSRGNLFHGSIPFFGLKHTKHTYLGSSGFPLDRLQFRARTGLPDQR